MKIKFTLLKNQKIFNSFFKLIIKKKIHYFKYITNKMEKNLRDIPIEGTIKNSNK